MKKLSYYIAVFALILAATLLLAPSKGRAETSWPHSVPIIANEGQFEAAVLYQWQGEGYIGWATADAIWLGLVGSATNEVTTVRLSWPELAESLPAGATPHQTTHSYYYGADEKSWFRDVATWSTLQWGEWQLVDFGQGLMILGAEPDKLIWQSDGSVAVEGNQLLFQKNGNSMQIPLYFAAEDTVAIGQASNVPAAGFGTFIGHELWDQADGIAVDAVGNSYTTGYTTSITFPDAVGTTSQHGIDIFLTKLNVAGTALDYVLHVNPNPMGLDTGQDYGQAIAVDADGQAHLVGRTDSPDFPRTAGSYDDEFQGPTDAYLLKFADDGSDLIFGTFINGTASENFDDARALALDESGNAYVAGGTFSPDLLPAGLPGYDSSHGGERDSFVVKVAADGSQLLWGSYLGGDSQESITALTVGVDDAVYVAGWTRSATGFPTTSGAYDTSFGGVFDGFVTVLEPAGTQLRYSTFVGGSGEDRAFALEADSAGQAIVAGLTISTDLATTAGAYDDSCGTDGNCNESGGFSYSDAFVLKLNQAGTEADYLTYLGGELADSVLALDLDDLNRPLLTGRTESTQFPTTSDALDDEIGGDVDAFLTRLTLSGDRLDYSAYIGGSDWDTSLGIASRPNNVVYLTGWTRWSTMSESDFPVTPGSYDAGHNGDYDIFILTYQFPVDQKIYLPVITRP
eukprot:jgi/Undpi1/12100/HiC_scaffold_41.g14073.m1